MNRRNIGNVYGEFEGERRKRAGGVISGVKEKSISSSTGPTRGLEKVINDHFDPDNRLNKIEEKRFGKYGEQIK